MHEIWLEAGANDEKTLKLHSIKLFMCLDHIGQTDMGDQAIQCIIHWKRKYEYGKRGVSQLLLMMCSCIW